MRTTILLPDELFASVKRLAQSSGQTFTDVVRAALQEAVLKSRTPEPKPPRTRLPIVAGRPLPGVDLDDSASLLDLMERR